MTGKELKERYPFLIPRNRFTDKICEKEPGDNAEWYEDWTELDEMPDGWRMAFGEQMCEEIREALLKEGGEQALNDYRIIQIKEKYGYLHWYDANTNDEIQKIIRKYEDISEMTCIRCGKPATKISKGWISPFCDDCANELSKDGYISFEPIFESSQHSGTLSTENSL